MSSLTVYRASAGSGKTFTLAVEYIKFLIKNPYSYRNILAVTFTNKATEEMKSRIIAQLYGISHSLHDSEPYLNKISDETGIDKETIRKMSELALTQLIHNYDYFHVETIDTFFQSVLRNLAKELDLSANLRIELNDKQIEEQAVDALIDELDSQSPLFSWLLSFIMDNIDENKGWNIIRSVKNFGKMIFDDEYRFASNSLKEKLTQIGFIEGYVKRLISMREEAKKSLLGKQKRFIELLNDNGLSPNDLKNGNRGIGSYFHKLTGEKLDDKTMKNATLEKCLNNAEEWAKKTDKRHDIIVNLANECLIPLLRETEEIRPKALETIVSVNATIRNMNNLRLLNDIERKVRDMNSEANRFLLSDTQYLLNTMISDSDSPFIFEKIGTMLHHIMIDEFQDTSVVQWKNFHILLNECISSSRQDEGVNNLIVGDVKQSIYRWRSGDWQLLNDIERYFPGKKIDILKLQRNFRSSRNIINFNNKFFSIVTKIEVLNESQVDEVLAEKISAAYADVCQEVNKEDTTGLVRIKLMSGNNDYIENTLNSIEETIDYLIEKNISLSHIAILVRTNKYIPMIAEYFMKNRPEISIVSDEAYRLDSSTAINIIISALRLLYFPDDMVTKVGLIRSYQQNIIGKNYSINEILSNQDVDNLMPNSYTKGIDKLIKLPLFDLCEELMSIFSLDKIKDEGAYVCAFFDNLSSYINDMSSDAEGFIKEWDETIHSKKIQTDDVNGIQLVSIHKSKGLEFDNVIIPFCDWRKEQYRDNYIWCHPSKSPYNEVQLFPINYSPSLSYSIYSADYRQEHMQNTIDNLNLLYVAFTRASKNLFIFGKRDDNQSRSMLLQSSFDELTKQLPDSILDYPEDKSSPITFEYGEFLGDSKKEESESPNMFMRRYTELNVNISTHKIPTVFRQSNKSKDFVENAEGDENKQSSYIKIGNILHLVFSNIRTTADIDTVLNQYESEGILYGEGLDRKKIQALLHEYLNTNSIVADWFSPHWTLYNECSILSLDPNTGEMQERRPDRVMRNGNNVIVVDFKFGKPQDSYSEQIKEYMKLLKSMWNIDVKGYIWYVTHKKIDEVSIESN